MELSVQTFGLDILQYLCRSSFDKNIVFSPLSIYITLGMALHGTKGSSSEEMIKVLHWDHENSTFYHQQFSDYLKTEHFDQVEGGIIKFANRIFIGIKYKLLDPFSQEMDTLYGGNIERLDFQASAEKARQKINTWVEEETSGKIVNIIKAGSIDKITKFILVNAIYFKGLWQDELNDIGERQFYTLNDQSKLTKMISKTGLYKYIKNDSLKFSAVQLPFEMMKENEYSLMIILPLEKTALPIVEKSIFQVRWNTVLNNEMFKSANVCVTMPKFKVDCSYTLKQLLIGLGMVTAFGKDADFSLMTKQRDLSIDEVIHKTYLDVNETGIDTEDASAMMLINCPTTRTSVKHQIDFTCDHPFMFALLKHGSLPMFMGHITQC